MKKTATGAKPATSWRGAEARVAATGERVSVVDTIESRYEAGVVPTGVTGEVQAATLYLQRVMSTPDTDRRAELLGGDVLVVKDAKGTPMVVHNTELTDVRNHFMGGLAAVLGGRPTVAPAPGESTPRAPSITGRERRVVHRVLESGRMGLGPFNRKAAERFAKTFGIKHVVLTANGSVPLTLAVKALGIGEGEEILTGATTFQATAGAMYDARVVPVLLDCVSTRNLTIDPEAVRTYLESTSRAGRRLPRAVIAVALYAQLPYLRKLQAVCKRFGLALILDFAHGPYAEIDARPATRFADIVTYSFQQSKSLSLGEGGAIATDRDELAAAIRMLVSCGYMPWDMLAEDLKGGVRLEKRAGGGFTLPPRYTGRQSVNFRMPEVQAAQLWARLETFMGTFDRAVENIARLQEVVRQFEGTVVPFDTITGARGPFYKWGFHFDPKSMPGDIGRWALRAQIGYEAIYCYPALTQGDQRNPLLPWALEGLVGNEYLERITQEWSVPNSEAALSTAALIEWAFLVRDDPAGELVQALTVLRRDRDLILARA